MINLNLQEKKYLLHGMFLCLTNRSIQHDTTINPTLPCCYDASIIFNTGIEEFWDNKIYFLMIV